MADVYKCYMEQKRWFNVIAEDDVEALEWIQTHNLQDVDNLTKNYTDEYGEEITAVFTVMDTDVIEGVHLEKEKSEKENETMNEKMIRLKALIDESNKIVDDVKAETKRLEEEHLKNRDDLLKDFQKKMLEYGEVIHMPNLKIDSGIDGYVFRLRTNDSEPDVFVSTKSDSPLGFILLRESYETVKVRGMTSYPKTLERILDEFDSDKFENNLAQAVQDMLTEKAAKADREYQEAKAKLEKDSEKVR